MIDELFVLAETVKTPEIKNHTIDGVSAIAALVIASFAVEPSCQVGIVLHFVYPRSGRC